MAKGCDTAAYLTDSRVDALVGKGYSFVGRYIDYLKGAHNDLTEKEVGLICNAGLEIVSLYQPKGMNSSTHYSASQGKSDVIEALELARYLRQPKNTAIYFCVDFDPLESVVKVIFSLISMLFIRLLLIKKEIQKDIGWEFMDLALFALALKKINLPCIQC